MSRYDPTPEERKARAARTRAWKEANPERARELAREASRRARARDPEKARAAVRRSHAKAKERARVAREAAGS